MSGHTNRHRALVARILEGDGRASREQRRAAFDNAAAAGGLVEKVALRPASITDEDLASGLSEDQVFELVVCAAVGEATRQYESGLRALAEATHAS